MIVAMDNGGSTSPPAPSSQDHPHQSSTPPPDLPPPPPLRIQHEHPPDLRFFKRGLPGHDASSFQIVRWLVLQGAARNRKAAVTAVREGRVRVDGEVVRSLAFPIQPQDRIELDGRVVERRHEKHIYYVLHKPAGCLCTRQQSYQLKGGGLKKDDRPTVYDYLPENVRLVINSIGRLDFDTSGLLLFTSDGHFHHVVASPEFKVPKIYRCTLRTREPLSDEAIRALDRGIRLPHAKGAIVRGDAWNVEGQPGVVDLRITGGYKHQVKLMMAVGVQRPLELLHRRTFAGLELPEDLAEGEARPLTDEELGTLYEIAESQVEKVKENEAEALEAFMKKTEEEAKALAVFLSSRKESTNPDAQCGD